MNFKDILETLPSIEHLTGLDILNLANSKQKPLYDKKEVKNLVTKISSPTDAEKILIENLSDKKKNKKRSRKEKKKSRKVKRLVDTQM